MSVRNNLTATHKGSQDWSEIIPLIVVILIALAFVERKGRHLNEVANGKRLYHYVHINLSLGRHIMIRINTRTHTDVVARLTLPTIDTHTQHKSQHSVDRCAPLHRRGHILGSVHPTPTARWWMSRYGCAHACKTTGAHCLHLHSQSFQDGLELARVVQQSYS